MPQVEQTQDRIERFFRLSAKGEREIGGAGAHLSENLGVSGGGACSPFCELVNSAFPNWNKRNFELGFKRNGQDILCFDSGPLDGLRHGLLDIARFILLATAAMMIPNNYKSAIRDPQKRSKDSVRIPKNSIFSRIPHGSPAKRPQTGGLLAAFNERHDEPARIFVREKHD